MTVKMSDHRFYVLSKKIMENKNILEWDFENIVLHWCDFVVE